MADTKIKLVIKQGATFRRRLTWKTGSPAIAVDLTGYTARMQVRAVIEDPVVLVDLTTENGGITLGGTAGTIDLFINDAATSAYMWDAGVFDLEMVAPGANGDVIRLTAGTVTVSPEVTR